MASDRGTNRIFSGSNGIQNNLWWERSQPLEINAKGVASTRNSRSNNKGILITANQQSKT